VFNWRWARELTGVDELLLGGRGTGEGLERDWTELFLKENLAHFLFFEYHVVFI